MLAAALWLAGCGPSTVEDLSEPALAVTVTESGGFCSSIYAVDGDGAVWLAGGCETEEGAFERRERTVSDAERAELDARMDEVQALSDDPECDVTLPRTRYRFVRTAEGAETEETTQCGPGVPTVALELADRLEALTAPPAPPADAGAGG